MFAAHLSIVMMLGGLEIIVARALLLRLRVITGIPWTTIAPTATIHLLHHLHHHHHHLHHHHLLLLLHVRITILVRGINTAIQITTAGAVPVIFIMVVFLIHIMDSPKGVPI